jgi:hypothetical protein
MSLSVARPSNQRGQIDDTSYFSDFPTILLIKNGQMQEMTKYKNYIKVLPMIKVKSILAVQYAKQKFGLANNS